MWPVFLGLLLVASELTWVAVVGGPLVAAGSVDRGLVVGLLLVLPPEARLPLCPRPTCVRTGLPCKCGRFGVRTSPWYVAACCNGTPGDG